MDDDPGKFLLMLCMRAGRIDGAYVLDRARLSLPPTGVVLPQTKDAAFWLADPATLQGHRRTAVARFAEALGVRPAAGMNELWRVVTFRLSEGVGAEDAARIMALCAKTHKIECHRYLERALLPALWRLQLSAA